MAKIGRPKAEVKKDKTITIRVTPVQHKQIREYAKTYNLSTTQVLYKGLERLFQKSRRVWALFFKWKGAE